MNLPVKRMIGTVTYILFVLSTRYFAVTGRAFAWLWQLARADYNPGVVSDSEEYTESKFSPPNDRTDVFFCFYQFLK